MTERMKFGLENINILPLVALRGLVVFPSTNVSFDIVRMATVKAVEKAMEGDKMLLLVTQKDILAEKPGFLDL